MHKLLAIVVTLGVALGCTSQKAPVESSGGNPADFELNFVGLSTADWPSSFRFYTAPRCSRLISRER